MPCRDIDWEVEDRARELAFRTLPAIACQLMRLHEKGLHPNVNTWDSKESGVSWKEFQSWWTAHQAEDAKRKLKEKAEAERKRLKKKALEKLSDAERRALGLK